MKSKTLLKILPVALAVLAVAGTAFANHQWSNFHWARTSNPFTLQLIDSVTAGTTGWDSYIGAASIDWSISTMFDMAIISGDDGNATRKRCPAVLGKDRICNAAYGNNGWLGLAQVWTYADGHIAQGTVKVNDTYFNTSTYNNPNEKLHVVCQEIGHTLGLDHQSTSGASLNTCMDYFSNTGANAASTLSTKPNQHDYDELVTIYTHLDITNTVFSSTNGGGKGKPLSVGENLDLNDPSAWGKAVRQDAHGNNSLYERDLGRGEKLFTFVTWAE